MLKKLFEKLRDSEKNYKKLMENLSICAIILVISILFINSFFSGKDETTKTQPNNRVKSEQSDTYNNSDLENKLGEILSKISGAGNVSVMVSYKSTIETIPLYDIKDNETITEEKDTNGGVRKTTQKGYENQIIYDEEGSGRRTPVIGKKLMPKVEGVIVVATGGDNVMVKNNILKAVEAVTDVPSHKIQIFSKSKVN